MMEQLNSSLEKEKTDTEDESSEEMTEPGMQRRDYIRMRLAELDEQDINIATRTDNEFLKRKAEIDTEYDAIKKRLDHFRQIQHQSVSRRTFGDYTWLQSSTEQEITEYCYKHNYTMYPPDLEMFKEYENALNKYEYLNTEIPAENHNEDKTNDADLYIDDNFILK